MWRPVLRELPDSRSSSGERLKDRGSTTVPTRVGGKEIEGENTMRHPLTWQMAGGGGGGDGLPGEPWPGPEKPPSPDGGPKFIG